MLDFFHTFLDRVEAMERCLVCRDRYPMADSLGWEIEIILVSMIDSKLQVNFLRQNNTAQQKPVTQGTVLYCTVLICTVLKSVNVVFLRPLSVLIISIHLCT